MKYIVAAIVIAAGISTTAQASVCDDLSASVDRNLKSIALINMYLISEKSGTERLTNTLSIGNEWQQININIQLMEQNKCAPLAAATNYNRFSAEAAESELASKKRAEEMLKK